MESDKESTATNQPKSVQVQQKYAELCTAMGDLTFKVEALKAEHSRVQEEYVKALAEEKEAKN